MDEHRVGTEMGAGEEIRLIMEMKRGTRMGMRTETRTGSRRRRGGEKVQQTAQEL